MKYIRGSTLFVVVSFVFASLLVTVMIMVVIVNVTSRFDLFSLSVPFQALNTAPVLLLVSISVIIGTMISAIFGRVIITPIKELSAATKEVAKGNFNISVHNESLNEIGQLTRDFNKMVKDLGSIETLRSDFVTNVSHEFKTPIASIEGCAALLQDDELCCEERKEYAKLIASSARRLSILTSNILRLSKLENQEIIAEQSEFSLDEQIRQAVLLLEPQWLVKNIDFDIDLSPITIFGSEELLMQVWLNLLNNAIKFSHNNGQIKVTLSSVGKTVVVSFADKGIGMSEETQKHIFEKFFQGNQAHSEQGNGLGLSLVKRILDLSKGQISVESKEGQGSTFTVILNVK